MKKLIVLATAVVALAIGTAVGLALSSAANPKVVVTCEGRSCSVQLPGAVLDEMNRTMTKTMAEASAAEKADQQAFLKELGKIFEEPTSQHDATAEGSDAEFIREVKRLFH